MMDASAVTILRPQRRWRLRPPPPPPPPPAVPLSPVGGRGDRNRGTAAPVAVAATAPSPVHEACHAPRRRRRASVAVTTNECWRAPVTMAAVATGRSLHAAAAGVGSATGTGTCGAPPVFDQINRRRLRSRRDAAVDWPAGVLPPAVSERVGERCHRDEETPDVATLQPRRRCMRRRRGSRVCPRCNSSGRPVAEFGWNARLWVGGVLCERRPCDSVSRGASRMAGHVAGWRGADGRMD